MSVLVIMAIVCLGCLFALAFGDWRERLGGAFYLTASGLCFLAVFIVGSHIQLQHLVVNGLCLIGFLYLSWKSPHAWPIWACVGQLMSVMAAIASLVHGITLWPYLTMQLLIGCGVLLALVTGTGASLKRKRDQPQK